MNIQHLRASMSAHWRAVTVVAAAVAVVGAALWWLVAGTSGCGSDDEAKAKALQLSSGLQAAAQQNKMTIQQLAETTRNLNAAATAYTSTNNRDAYCAALDKIRRTNHLAD